MKLICCQAINLTALSYGQFIKFLCLTFAKAKSIFTSLSKDVVDTRHLMFPSAPARFIAAAAGVLAWPEHAIGMVGHLFEGHRPEDVGGFTFGFGLRAGTGAEVRGGKPGQEMTHQIGHGPKHLGIPVITWQGSGCTRR